MVKQEDRNAAEDDKLDGLKHTKRPHNRHGECDFCKFNFANRNGKREAIVHRIAFVAM